MEVSDHTSASIPITMRAARFVVGRIMQETRTAPTLGPGEVLLRVHAFAALR
jgi:hypothetical protein